MHRVETGEASKRGFERICNKCGKSFINKRKHMSECEAVQHGHPHYWTEEEKKIISEKRKKYLAEHPDEHPWKKNSKFKSIPCEDFKNFLRNKGYKFEEEVKIIQNRNFSADICFPDLMLIFEINGNQHYNLRTMELLPYYQERHNAIEAFGWCVVEIPYNQSYNEEFRMGLCRQLDAKLTSNQYLCRFESCQPYLEALKDAQRKKDAKNKIRQEFINQGKIRSDGHIDPRMLSNSEWEERKKLITNSGVDLSKFGWVSKVERKTGLSKRKIEKTVEYFNLSVFKRNKN